MTTRTAIGLLFLASAAGVAGCDVDDPAVGGLRITAAAPAMAEPATTADGWTVTWTRFLVHVSEVSVHGDDGVLAASAGPQIIDLVAPDVKALLSASVRTARPWQSVGIEIGPAAAETEIGIVPPVTEADRDRMVTGGISIHVEATAAKEGVTKSLAWDIATDTRHGACEENGVRGLVVPPNGEDAANVTFDGGVLLSDDLDAPGVALRAGAIAAADANADGTVTLEELDAVTLDAARAAGGTYNAGAQADVQTLGGFVAALSRRTLRTWRTAGTCTPEAVLPE